MNTLITSLVYFFPDTSEIIRSQILGMLDIWAQHLRGPGCYEGDIVVYTNDSAVSHPLLETVPFSRECEDVKEMFMQRIKNYDVVEPEKYDSILNLDLDILAVSDIAELFVQDDSLSAATSQMKTSHPRQRYCQMLCSENLN
jgi:hypothetical protein